MAKKSRGQDTPLTKKQIIFLQEYAKCLNATKAAQLAGYSERSAHDTGSRILKKTEAQEYLRTLIEKANVTTEITVENILKETAKIAFARINVKDADKLKALELLGKKFGLWDGVTGNNAGKDRSSKFERILEAVERVSGRRD